MVTDLNETRKKAENFFKKKFPFKKDEAGDFGAYCIEQWLQSGHTKRPFQYLAIDYLRKFVHCSGAGGSSDLMVRSTKLQENSDFIIESNLNAHSSELRTFDESYLFCNRKLSERQRIILVLIYKYGFQEKEIGNILQVSGSRISQLHTQALQIQKTSVSEQISSSKQRDRESKEQTALSSEQINSWVFRKKEACLDQLEKTKSRIFQKYPQTTQNIQRENSLLFQIKQDAWLLPKMVLQK